MIDFLVISGERSGSTWVANWLTTDTSVCFHDPRLRWTESEMSRFKSTKRIGIACTGTAINLDGVAWANRQPVPTLVLHRDPKEIEASWARLGVRPFKLDQYLDSVVGWHVRWDAVRDPAQAAEIYEFLLHKSFDSARHRELCQMNVQPAFEGIQITPRGLKEMTERMAKSKELRT